ncbi:MAG: NUDIX domain-containing protein [Ignavibacteria bacterium]
MHKRVSAGLLMYRLRDNGFEVLLAHPGGPFFKNKDDGHWSIPKGEPDENEELLVTAVREFKEETGITPHQNFIPLGTIVQKGGKTVYCWAFEGEYFKDPSFKSNEVEIEWPAHSGKKIKFPEIDKVEFFSVKIARQKIKETQIKFIDRLEEKLNL